MSSGVKSSVSIPLIGDRGVGGFTLSVELSGPVARLLLPMLSGSTPTVAMVMPLKSTVGSSANWLAEACEDLSAVVPVESGL